MPVSDRVLTPDKALVSAGAARMDKIPVAGGIECGC